MQKVIAVANQKGGVGKTTTVVNLSSYLAQMGKRVLVVDLDPQANSTSGLGLNKAELNSTLYHCLFDPKLIASSIVHTQHGISILPSSGELAAAEVELVQELGREHRLKKILETTDFDYVLIDCPPSLGLLTINALSAAQYVLIPVQAEFYALEGLRQLLETISRVRKVLNPSLSLLGVLVTMFNSRTTLSSEVYAEVQKHFSDRVFKTVIPRNVRLAEAPSHGVPVHTHDKWSKGARSYKSLAKEVISRVS